MKLSSILSSAALGLTMLMAASPAHAAALGSCKGLNAIELLQGVPRHFDQGVMVTQVARDYDGGANFLLVFAYGDDDYVECHAVMADSSGKGFSEIDASKIKVIAKTSGSELLSVGATVYDEKTGESKTQIVKIKIQSKWPAATITLK